MELNERDFLELLRNKLNERNLLEVTTALALCGNESEVNVEAEVIKESDSQRTVTVAENNIDNWEVHGSNSGCTGIVYNYPNVGDESVCLKNRITNRTVYKVLGK